jgi:hypothetical protein
VRSSEVGFQVFSMEDAKKEFRHDVRASQFLGGTRWQRRGNT